MSRVGKSPVEVSKEVKVTIDGNTVEVVGPKGKLKQTFPQEVFIEYKESKLFVNIVKNTIKAKAAWGLVRSLLNNMVKGVKDGFTKILEISGVGYRASVEGGILTLSIGFSHEIKYVVPSSIQLKCLKPTQIEISGCDKQQVGQVAAEIRLLRKPEPYKGKGIRYDNETIRRKEGKKK